MQKNDFPKLTIGVDHGYKNMKTPHCVFPTKLGQLMTVPDDKKGILQLDNKIYTESGKDVNYVNSSDKVLNENFYILTLIAIAKELQFREFTEKPAKTADGHKGARVNMAVGLPQKWFDTQKDSFRNYLMKRSEVHFRYEGSQYHIYFEDCKVFTQGYAAFVTLDKIDEYLNKNVVVCDVGGGTVDIIIVNKGQIDYVHSKIDQKGAIWLVNSIKEEAEATLYEPIPEDFIVNYMISKNIKEVPQDKYEQLVQNGLINYCEMIFNRLKEFRINVNITSVIFVGGGACIIENFGHYNPATTNFVTDIKANANGYELIYNLLS